MVLGNYQNLSNTWRDIKLEEKLLVLEDYLGKLEKWRRDETPVKDLTNLGMEEAFLMVVKMHSSNKKLSMDYTKAVLMYFENNKIAVAVEIKNEVDISYPALYKRLNILTKYGLLRKVGEFFIATPRLSMFVKEYMIYLATHKSK